MFASSAVVETEWLLRTEEGSARISTLPPGRETPWHRHTEVPDRVFCLEGEVQVDLARPDESVRLAPGQRHDVPPGRIHRVRNPGEVPARYLLVQGPGRHDFVRVEIDPFP